MTAVPSDIGMHEGVAYRIDIPSNWNHELVVFYHGYSIDPVTFPPPLSPMFEPFLQRHYAVLQSAYSQAGWAVEFGWPADLEIRDTADSEVCATRTDPALLDYRRYTDNIRT